MISRVLCVWLIRWDKFLPLRTADTPYHRALEHEAKQELQEQQTSDKHAVADAEGQQASADDRQEQVFLPLKLRPLATTVKGSAAPQSSPGKPEGESMGRKGAAGAEQRPKEASGSNLQHLREAAQQARRATEGAGEPLKDGAPWTSFNDSDLTPLIPQPVMWLVAEAEELLRNDTWFNLDIALDLSHLQSVAYCHFPNVAAWNCSRSGSSHSGYVTCCLLLLCGVQSPRMLTQQL
jgi:hypothetical protein